MSKEPYDNQIQPVENLVRQEVVLSSQKLIVFPF